MNNEAASPSACADLHSFVRNRYFYGKLLDVCHFESEQSYFNRKRWMINRLVSGYGVVCGLDVRLTEDRKSVQVYPGVAFDKCGHEIIVPAPSTKTDIPTTAPETPPGGERNTDSVKPPCEDDRPVSSLWICWHECPEQPERVTAPECGAAPACPSGSIRESYELELRPCPAHPIDATSQIPDAFAGGRLNYRDLAEYVTACCPEVPPDCCIPLANIRLPFEGNTVADGDIDISIRPIVYSNDLLFEMVLGLMAANQARPKGGKN